MNGPSHSRGLEQRMTVARWVAVAVGAAILAARSSWPDDSARLLTWAVVVALASGNLLVWRFLTTSTGERIRSQLHSLAFVLDAVVVTGFALSLATPQDDSWPLLLLIAIEGGLRFRLRGGVIATGVVAVASTIHSLRVMELEATGPAIGRYLFLVGLAAAVGILIGSVMEHWHASDAALERQRARLVELDTNKDQYIAITTHEIRGPLTAIIAGVETLRRRWNRIEPDRRESLLDLIKVQGYQLERLVEDLSISAEVQSGGLALNPEWVELEPTIRRALEAAAPKRRSHLLEVFVEPLRCEIDPHRVAQVVRNLVENAYKYTPDRTKVAVSARGNGGGIVLEVSDVGEGIPVEKRDQLFEAFSRIEETSAGREGVGLGLYVVSQLVAVMDGHIDLSSSSRGTRFSISIPCRKAHADRPQIGLVQDPDRASG